MGIPVYFPFSAKEASMLHKYGAEAKNGRKSRVFHGCFFEVSHVAFSLWKSETTQDLTLNPVVVTMPKSQIKCTWGTDVLRFHRNHTFGIYPRGRLTLPL